jgi:predicted metal-dependent hydrolase
MLPSAEVTIAGRSIRYMLRVSPRARGVSASIRPETGLVVTLPAGADVSQADVFLLWHQRWVVRHLDRLAARTEGLPRPWPYGTSFLYRGDAHTVVVQQARPGGIICTPDQHLLVGTPSAGIEGARRVLRRWLCSEAAQQLEERVAVWAARMGHLPRRIYVRRLRSSWGRCWPGGALSFDYRLMMAPPRILDYVVVHELAHLQDRTHSPHFWSIVAGQLPAHREDRAWLRTFGPCLAV